MRFRDRQHQMTVFYQAQDSSLRCIARSRNLKFLLGDDRGDAVANVVRCRQLANFPEPGKVSGLRGQVDARAVRDRFGVKPGWFKRLGFKSIALHETLEQIRCEYLASRWLPGVRKNLLSVAPETIGNDVLNHFIHRLRYECGLNASQDDKVDTELNRFLALLKGSCDDALMFHRVVRELSQHIVLPPEPDKPLVLNLDQDGEDTQAKPENLESGQSFSEKDDDPILSSKSESVKKDAYRVFDTSFDEVIDATELSAETQGEALRKKMDRELRTSRISFSRLAGRLLTALLTNVNEDWEYEHEEGLLDTNRLGGLVVNPLSSRIYRRQSVRKKRDTLVTILVDNSGSMRGQPIMTAALCTDMLARTLERCGVGVEVLGFTTAWWRGGEVRQHWIEQGKPSSPGRLNGLRHIVYKSADRRWRHSRFGIAQMLEPSLLKENIDGEALEWAVKRMRQRPETRKILLLVSDGAPRDEATSEANEAGYLESHLREVIVHLEEKSDIELTAIGIGHDVSRYYRNSVQIDTVSDLGETLVDRLCLMLTNRSVS